MSSGTQSNSASGNRMHRLRKQKDIKTDFSCPFSGGRHRMMIGKRKSDACLHSWAFMEA